MTPRRVVLALEVETDAPLRVLRKAGRGIAPSFWFDGEVYEFHVVQAQANVVRRTDDE